MPRYKEWTITLTVAETANDRPEPTWGPGFYSATQLKHELRKALEENLKSVRVEAVTIIEGSEYV